MAKNAINNGDNASFQLRQIFDLTGKVDENLATLLNLRLSLVLSPQIHTLSRLKSD